MTPIVSRVTFFGTTPSAGRIGKSFEQNHFRKCGQFAARPLLVSSQAACRLGAIRNSPLVTVNSII
jgi:hypothetical protein